jgi:hypothetical protein
METALKVTIHRTLGLIPVETKVEVEIDALPLSIGERLSSPSAVARTDDGRADTRRVRITVDQSTVEVDESRCCDDELDAIDELWSAHVSRLVT